ncbi:MAG: YidC/Oxa1 family membrane protein insertase [Clostridiales Family XIII bacterium]|jgi:YidC/Oxa1 family membrane protein insertase|nr:YidC/Oxa1 family membrane protein insertase [Clostridiales Family XIII bacterium]
MEKVLTKALGFIAVPLGYLLTGIYEVVGNYGVTLIIFTIIVRLCLFPLYANQIKHQMKMADVQPKMQALQKKYAHDKEELNRKMMELYKEENFNPMRGCLPMLIQMPILLGLFALLRDPTAALRWNYADMIFAVHEGFFWMKDLSQPDLWILPIMAGITTYISFSLTQTQSQVAGDNAQANQMAGMMKMMKYFFPVMIVWMGRSFPAGLALYWFIGNLCTIVQYQVLRLWRKRLERMRAEGKGGPLFRK